MGKKTKRGAIWLFAVVLISMSSAKIRAEAQPNCPDPVFVQYQARISEKPRLDARLKAWREFLQHHPENPCTEAAKSRIRSLEASATRAEEVRSEQEWKQQARGGLIEPGQDVFSAPVCMADPVGRYRMRLLTELAAMTAEAAFRTEARDLFWTQILRIDAAPVYNLSLSLDVPLVAGFREEEGFGYAIGNIVAGVRGIWGAYLDDQSLPLVVSAGIWWGTGSSSWSAASLNGLLDAAAFTMPYSYHLYKVDQADYAMHAESQLGVGRHTFALGIAYHIVSQGKPLNFKRPPVPLVNILRADLAYQLKILDWLIPFAELNLGICSPQESRASFFYLSPGIQVRSGRMVGSLAIRVPFWDVRDFSRMVITFEIGVDLLP